MFPMQYFSLFHIEFFNRINYNFHLGKEEGNNELSSNDLKMPTEEMGQTSGFKDTVNV